MTNFPAPDNPLAPKYWINETGGELVPAIQRYMKREPLSGHDVYLIRAYLRQWIGSPVWLMNPGLTDEIRQQILDLRTRATNILTWKHIKEWIDKAIDLGMDPL
jgi:hypothetical protein